MAPYITEASNPNKKSPKETIIVKYGGDLFCIPKLPLLLCSYSNVHNHQLLFNLGLIGMNVQTKKYHYII